MQFPSFFRGVVDGTNLLNVLDSNVGSSLVFDEDVLPVSGVVFVVGSFRESNAVVFGVVTDAVLFPRYG